MEVVPVLWHTPSNSYFHFDLNNQKHWCEFSPGDQTPKEQHAPGSWSNQLANVGYWLTYLRREIQAPDLWAMLAGGSSLSAAAAPEQLSENAAFSVAERRRIEKSLAEIRSLLLASHDVSASSLKQVDARLEYLEQASERLGRKDWLNVALAVVVNIIMTAAVPPETARTILSGAGSILSWVLGGSPLLPNTLQ